MTRVARFHELGGPEVLRIEDAEPDAPPASHVRLRVHAIGVNRAEAQFRRGQYVEQARLPSRIGYEAAGVVEAIGPAVETVGMGQRAVTLPAFSMSERGVYGDTAVVPAGALAPWPEGLSAEQAASIWMSFLTAWGGLVKHGEVRRGEHVLVTAASSSVGLASIQVLKREGAGVIASTRSARKVDTLSGAGADHVVVTSREDLVDSVMRVTNGRGVDCIFDAVAGPGLDALGRLAGDRCRIVLYGYFGGIQTSLPLIAMFLKDLRLKTFSILRLVSDAPLRDAGIRYVLDGVRNRVFRPMLDRIFPFDEVAAAHAYLESNEQVGKVALRVRP